MSLVSTAARTAPRAIAAPSSASTAAAGWLRYLALDPDTTQQYGRLPVTVVALGSSPVEYSAQTEIVRGLGAMLGGPVQSKSIPTEGPAIILGTVAEIPMVVPQLKIPGHIPDDGFWLTSATVTGFPAIIVAGSTDRGVLYGAFALLRKIAMRESLARLDETESPYAPIRWVNEWDNLDGSMERGYGGASIFFENGNVRADLSRAQDYARLLASVGINGCAINNVNADPKILSADFIPQLARVADAFRPFGMKLAVSVNFASPKSVGGLDTFDPLDPRVIAWWAKKSDEIYAAIPDFGGYVLKADSEDRPGPATYHRTAVDGANALARALKPHGGLLFYRGFVYDHHLDWRNPKADRATAAYNNFHPFDGAFDSNVIVQIKNGPIDFQVREPVSPLFGGLKKTNEAVELQITQEYLGQGRHLVYLPPMWKQVLDFDMHANRTGTPVKAIVAGKVFPGSTGGLVGVSNVGLNPTWLGSYLSVANLYGFGRLAWNPDLTAKQIADEWTRLTFGNDPAVVEAIVSMQMHSWKMYEDYTGPLGAGTLTAIAGDHYGPSVESSEHNGWGQWHRADSTGIGMDRTVATGTGFVGQYPPAVAQIYESLAECPDELLLFFHHVPYTYRLHSGKTVIQHIYDSHYDGAALAEANVARWKSLAGRMDPPMYAAVLARLEYQAGAAQLWRDAICSWFLKTSGIPDERGRAGHFPGRVEAESMQLDGYEVIDVEPWESASGGKAVECTRTFGPCSATTVFLGKPGEYDIDVRYFDLNSGVAKFKLFLDGHNVSNWLANDNLPGNTVNGSSSTRHRIAAVSLRPGDTIRVEAAPDGGDRAALDYIEVRPTVN